MAGPHLYIAIPVINELAYLPATLESIAKQSFKGSFSVIICVNQPEEWWQDPEKVAVCENNQQLIQFLKQYSGFVSHLDYSSPGKGWIGKTWCGLARKVLFDHIMQIADDQDIVISLDADTQFKEHYFQSIYERFTQEGVHALSVPYYHPLGKMSEPTGQFCGMKFICATTCSICLILIRRTVSRLSVLRLPCWSAV